MGVVVSGIRRGVRIDDDDVALLEVVHERVHVRQVHAAALVVAALSSSKTQSLVLV